MSRFLRTPAVAMLLLTMTVTIAPAQNSSSQRVTKRIPYPTFVVEVLVDAADRLGAALVIATHDIAVVRCLAERWLVRDGTVLATHTAGAAAAGTSA